MNSDKRRNRERQKVSVEKVNELLKVLDGMTLEEWSHLSHAVDNLYTARKYQVEKENMLVEMPEDAQFVLNILKEQNAIQSQSE